MSGKETVNHPEHYCSGGYEAIDVMVAVFGKKAVVDFCICNAFKYLWRKDQKGGVEDLKKARWYLDKSIELEDGLKEDESLGTFQKAVEGFSEYVSMDLSKAVDDAIKGMGAQYYIYGRNDPISYDQYMTLQNMSTVVIPGEPFGYQEVYVLEWCMDDPERYKMVLLGAMMGKRDDGDGE